MGMFDQIMPIESPIPIFKHPAMVRDHPTARTAPTTVNKESKPMQRATMAVPRNEQPPRKSIFILGSPERENKTKRDEGFGVFLQACSLCKKKLKLDKDIYMYGYLGAFCSPDCRDDRIALDGIGKEVVFRVPRNMAPSKRF